MLLEKVNPGHTACIIIYICMYMYIYGKYNDLLVCESPLGNKGFFPHKEISVNLHHNFFTVHRIFLQSPKHFSANPCLI